MSPPDTEQPRVALVTGASRGIGAAIAHELATDHHVLVHHRRSPEEAEAVRAGILAEGGSASVVAADIADPAELDILAGRVVEDVGRLDVLVANAAGTRFTRVDQARPHHVDLTFAVVDSLVHLVRRTAPVMPRGSSIIAVGGLDARVAQAGHGVLGAAKAALEALVRSLAVELGPAGIRANVVVPGAIETASLDVYLREREDLRQLLVTETPLGRLGAPEDVAGVVRFLCSPLGAFISGQSIVVDGGLSAGGGPWGPMRDLWA